MTANSLASVSLDPPLVLMCVGRAARMHDNLTAVGSFGVSVLAADQEPVARHFANRRRPAGLAQFDAIDWRPGRLTGAPLIVGAAAQFECRLWRTYDGGDHTIFLGEILTLHRRAGDEVLVFLHGEFRPTGRVARHPEPSEVTT
jgi:flavin reductase (DIM6/NTAB) family NADH-FMN oxidoreductase RutF